MLRMENIKTWEPARLEQALPVLFDHLEKIVAARPDAYTVRWLVDMVKCGIQDLWVVVDDETPDVPLASCITEVMHYKATGRSFCRIIGLGGERLDDVLPFLPELERALGVSKIEVVGREGWRRKLKAYGYELTMVILTKSIGD